MTKLERQIGQIYAHSVPGKPSAEWEALCDHLRLVSETCARFAGAFGFSEMARAAGLLHDIGKCSAEFQAYIREPSSARGPDHSSAGAQEAHRAYGRPVGRILGYIVAGHHAGLADGEELARRLGKSLSNYGGWQAEIGMLPLPALSALAPTRRLFQSDFGGFTAVFLIRMLFSSLVDADRLETSQFYGVAARVEATPLSVLRDRLQGFMGAMASDARSAAATGTQRRLNTLRSEILDAAVTKAALAPGLFTLTVPTGGGKTLASLSFALEHAVRHGLHRVVYVIPFTSIIDQTTPVFRAALGAAPDAPNETDIVEHHASFDWDAALGKSQAAGEAGGGTTPAEQLQRATENWDAPIIVTTAVQFFESLFARGASACRKLHNLAGAVIVLDEAQTLPIRILKPCLAAIDELARNYGASIVICTATQPAWRKGDGTLVEKRGSPAQRNFGLDVPPERELAPDPKRLFMELKRVEVEYRPAPISDAPIAERFAEAPQMLCIVNSRRHAKALFDAIVNLPGAIHLSTWMCPRHRRLVLEQARAALKAGEPTRIVSTSLIEAGVDIDLPEVWRAATGVDSLLQAAGRCNREFRQAAGRLVIFVPGEDRAPHDLKQSWEAGRAVLRRHPDPQTLEAIQAYFRELYVNAGDKALDASKLGGEIWPILGAISERADTLDFPFASIAQAFKVVEETMTPVIVPWSSGPQDSAAKDLLARIAAMDKPLRGDLRRLQQYTVSVPETRRNAWLAAGVLRPVHPEFGEAMLRLEDLALYDPRSGLRVDEPEHRSPESNVM